MATLDLELAVLGLGVVTTMIVAALAWRNREKSESLALVGVMLTSGGWAFKTFLAQFLGQTQFALLWGEYGFLFIPLTVLTFVVFSLLYSGYEEYVTPLTVATLSMHTVLVFLFILTNDLHHMFWHHPELGSNNWGRGVLWWAHSTYSYVALAVSAGLIVRKVFGRDDLYRGQAIAISIGVFVPWIGNALFIFNQVSYDYTPVGFAVTGLAMLWAVGSYDLTEVTPVAKQTVIDNIESGIIVLDENDVVTEINGKAVEMFDVDDDRSLIGSNFEEMFSHLPAFYERYADVEDTRDEIEVEIDDLRTYEVQVTPVKNKRGNESGRLFMITDVTERKRRERELELQNKQLDQFASVLSHEIQSPLDDVRGRVERTLDRVNTEDRGELLQAKQSLDDMDELVDDVLAMASEGGAVRAGEADRVSLQTVADEAWWSVTRRELPATLEVPDHDVMADPDRLQRIFENLFENAVKYGGENVSIEVGVVDDRTTGERGFYVMDDGPGIPEDARTVVFDAGVSGSDESPGLGLTIVETMTEAHDWDVRATTGRTGGARFEVTGVDFPERRVPSGQAVVGRTQPGD